MANPTPDSVQMTTKGALPRDDNDNAIQYAGIYINNPITLTGNNTTVNVPVFHVTGSVLVTGLWGVVTTTLGANHTASAWRLNDQSAQVYITAVGGVDISNAVAGSVVVKKGLVAAASVYLNNGAGVVSEPTTLETLYFSPCVLVKKTAAVTDIEYHYATTDTPTIGAIQFFASYIPISSDGKLTTV